MSEPENFLERWSRRKRDAAETAPPKQDARAPQQNDEAPLPPAADRPKAAPASESFDLSSLPSIESIDGNTDVRAFLRPGVPSELTRAALRRAWSTDPIIRDFVGLVENGWDFNDPDGIPGFGTISAGDVARLLSQAAGEPAPEAADASTEPRLPEDGAQSSVPEAASSDSPSAAELARPAPEPDAADVQCSEDDALQNDPRTPRLE